MLRSWEDPLAMSVSEKRAVGSPIPECPKKVGGQGVLTSASHAFFIFCLLELHVLWCQGLSFIVSSHNV